MMVAHILMLANDLAINCVVHGIMTPLHVAVGPKDHL